MQRVINQIQQVPVIPVLTLDDEKIALQVAHALVEGGIKCIEVTLRTHGALRCIEVIKKEFLDVVVGAGTIVNTKQLLHVKEVGADFAVSPGFTKNLVEEAKRLNFAYLPGASTPSEVMYLGELGVKYQKFFHATKSGGIDMLKVYKALFGNTLFCPTGGVGEKDYLEYLKLENVFCIGGSWMVTNQDIQECKFANITQKAEKIVQNCTKR